MRRSNRKRQLSTKLREYTEVAVAQDGTFTETSDEPTDVITSPVTKPVSTKGKVGRPRKNPVNSENQDEVKVTAGGGGKVLAETPKQHGSGKVGRPRKYATSPEKKSESAESVKSKYSQDGKYSPTKVIVIKPAPKAVDKAASVHSCTTDNAVDWSPGSVLANTEQRQHGDNESKSGGEGDDVVSEAEPCSGSNDEDSSNSSTRVPYPHISLLHKSAEWPLVTCRSHDCGCGLVHCPLCPLDKFNPRTMSKARKHFKTTHIGHSTLYGDVLICMCYLACEKETPHHHCPRCGTIYCRRKYIEAHLKKCSGVPRAQPRKQPAPVNRLANNLWLTLKEETGTERSRRPLDFGTFTHVSFVHELKDLDVTRCTEEGCSKFHCPLCPPRVFKPAFPQKVKDHLRQGHWKQRFMYRGVTILKCCLPCMPRVTSHGESHWHCPRCPLKVTSRGRLQYHLKCHDQGTTRSLRRTEELPLSDTEQEDNVCNEDDSHEPMNELETELPEEEEQTDEVEKSANKEIFQMVAAVLTTDLLQLIPGSKAVFFEALHAQTNVQYQLADKDQWCLLHANKWQQLKQAGAVLENISQSPPATVEDLTAKLTEYDTETADYLDQTQDEQERQQDFAASLIAKMLAEEHNFMTESVGDEDDQTSCDNANDSATDWPTEEPAPKRTKLDTSSPSRQVCLQVKTEDATADSSHNSAATEERGKEEESTTQEEESVVIKQEPVTDGGHGVTLGASRLSSEHSDANRSTGVGDTPLPVKDDVETPDIQRDGVDDTGHSFPNRRCPLCNRLFETRSKLLTHLVSANCILFWGEDKQIPEDLAREIKAMEEVQGTTCPRCGKTFQYKRNAKTHYALNLCNRAPVRRNPEKLVRDATTNRYHCRHCDFTALSPKKILEHEARSHLEKKYECSVCRRKYGSEYLLGQHVKWTHVAEKTTVVCHVCGRTLKSKYLNRHLQICHDPNYVQRERRAPGSEVRCPKCPYVGHSMRGLRRHHARRHDEKTLQCGQCNARFALGVDLSRHVLVMHSEDGPIRATVECPHCKKAMLKKNLDVHIRNVHEKLKEHVCVTCSKAFQTKYTLHCHLETHKKRSERTYKFLCAVCGGSFNNKTVYRDHVNMHTGNRPYQCGVCSKAFKQISTYSRHMNLHRSGGRFQCSVCGESFTRQRLLDAHTSSRHSDKLMCLCGLQFDSMQEADSHKAACTVWLGQAVDQQTTTEIENLLALAQEQSEVIADGAAAATVLTADGETLFLFQDDKLVEESQQGTLLLVNKQTSDDTMVTLHADAAVDDRGADAMAVSSDVNLIVTEMDVTKQEGTEEIEGEEQSFLCGYCQQLFVGLELVQNHMLTAHLNELPQDTDQIQLALHPSQEDDCQTVDGLLLSQTDEQQLDTQQMEAPHHLESYPVDAQQLVLEQTDAQEVELQQVDAQLLVTDQTKT